MFTKELPRIDTAKIADQLKAGRADLLSDAAKHLGYRTTEPTNLLQKLIALEISPFKTAAVEAYKKSKEKTTMYSGTRIWILWLSLSVLSGVTGICLSGAPAAVLCIGGAISTLMSFLIGLAAMELPGSGRRTVIRWQRAGFSSYAGAVPDHVLQKAVEIKKAYPNLSLGIDYLESQSEVVARDPDPFLTVTDGGTTYYVEQWDERDFPTIEE